MARLISTARVMVRTNRKKIWLLSTIGLLWLGATILVVVPMLISDQRPTLTAPLAELIPARLEGWQVRDLELADSEEMRSTVLKILQFDQVVYRSYRKGSAEVQIYAAYWKPGSVPYGQAGVHTPDTCWVNAGWTMDKRNYSQALRINGRELKPAETGDFSKDGRHLYVMFWHLVGDEVHSYQQYGWRNGLAGILDRLPNLFRDIRRYGLNLAQEQKFVRISSNMPLDQLLGDPDFEALMRGLERVGIFASKPT